ncbi:MAG: NTP transferase domain-containing protein, partial [Candidatus Gastranaerophilales bacterium]|nr:NTP transferase domain-containing protein [Candidatus Gastranaerophilales bacterium]
MDNDNNIKAIILAAGKGTRMKSASPKVLHKIFEKPLLGWVLDSVNNMKVDVDSIVVVGHGADEVNIFLDKE